MPLNLTLTQILTQPSTLICRAQTSVSTKETLITIALTLTPTQALALTIH